MIIDPDKRLVQKAQKGDKSALGELARRYYDMVYAVTFGVLGKREDALDATQDVFMKLEDRIQKFRGDSKFKSWLYRIGVNQAIDNARKKRPADPIDQVPDLATHERGPRQAAVASELKEVVSQALQTLKPEERVILILREFQGLSYSEIAETLELEKGTVMSRLHYARKALAKRLQGFAKE
jgi:RNA polymerase sigma-70 factor (ECF subfamily)